MNCFVDRAYFGHRGRDSRKWRHPWRHHFGLFRPTRECERELIKLNPEIVPARLEKVRDLTDDLVEVKFVMSRKAFEKIQRAKEIMSHSVPNGEMSKVMEQSMDGRTSCHLYQPS